MAEEHVSKSYIVENEWTCGSCQTVNKGRDLKCTKCGAPKGKDEKDSVDINSAQAVQDEKLINMANAGANWVCGYCGAQDRYSSSRFSWRRNAVSPSTARRRRFRWFHEASATPDSTSTACSRWSMSLVCGVAAVPAAWALARATASENVSWSSVGTYVREKRALSLPAAIHKMTWLAAQRFGFKDRGRIAKGFKADITVFDPAKVQDHATTSQPEAKPDGIPLVIVNGKVVLQDGAPTGVHSGVAIRNG